MHDYEQFAKERCHRRMSSLQRRMHAIAVFLDFLRSRGVTTLDRMQADFLGHVDVKKSLPGATHFSAAAGFQT